MVPLKTVNERIKFAMEQEGHTVASLARKCNRPDNTIRSIVDSARNPRFDILVDIIKAFDGKYDANYIVMAQESKIIAVEKEFKRLHATIDRLTKANLELTESNYKLISRLFELNESAEEEKGANT